MFLFIIGSPFFRILPDVQNGVDPVSSMIDSNAITVPDIEQTIANHLSSEKNL
jgi:hypothetical protein